MERKHKCVVPENYEWISEGQAPLLATFVNSRYMILSLLRVPCALYKQQNVQTQDKGKFLSWTAVIVGYKIKIYMKGY